MPRHCVVVCVLHTPNVEDLALVQEDSQLYKECTGLADSRAQSFPVFEYTCLHPTLQGKQTPWQKPYPGAGSSPWSGFSIRYWSEPSSRGSIICFRSVCDVSSLHLPCYNKPIKEPLNMMNYNSCTLNNIIQDAVHHVTGVSYPTGLVTCWPMGKAPEPDVRYVQTTTCTKAQFLVSRFFKTELLSTPTLLCPFSSAS